MTTCRVLFTCVCTLLLLVVTSGCKESGGEASRGSQDESAHPAAERATTFLDALKYGDAGQAAALHLEGTESGFYCSEEAFVAALERASREKSDSECQRVEALSAAQLDELPQESQLLIQIVRFTCEFPDAGCSEYGERVLRSQLAERLDEVDYTWAIEDWKIKKVIGDQKSAVVYVDITRPGDRLQMSHETMAMKKVSGSWYISEPLLDAESPRVP